MKRPVKRKSHFKIKVQRRDIARAEQKKLMAEWRKNFESGKMPTIGETFFSTTLSRSRSVRSLATISNLGGSMAKRRHQIVRAGKATIIVSDDITSYYPRQRKPASGSRRIKYHRKHFPTRIEDIDYLAMLNRPELQVDPAIAKRWSDTFLEASADRQQVKSEIKDGTRPMPTTEELDDLQRRGEGAFRKHIQGSPHFSFRGVIDSIINPSKDDVQFASSRNMTVEEAEEWKAKFLPMAQGGHEAMVASVRKWLEDNPNRAAILEQLKIGPQYSFQEKLEAMNDQALRSLSVSRPKGEKLEGGYQYGIKMAFDNMAAPQTQEDEIFINQRQADTLQKTSAILKDNSPLPITRGHYGDLMAASQYPGMKRIADELFKNGVEFIEASDPRAKLADYSVCFMYPHTISALDISKDTTQSEIDKFKPFDDIANWPSLEDQLQQLRLNSLKHLDPQNVVNSVQKWMDGDNNKEEGNPNNEDQD
jgi:hypothetical protein